jgi:hypothetical protein
VNTTQEATQPAALRRQTVTALAEAAVVEEDEVVDAVVGAAEDADVPMLEDASLTSMQCQPTTTTITRTPDRRARMPPRIPRTETAVVRLPIGTGVLEEEEEDPLLDLDRAVEVEEKAAVEEEEMERTAAMLALMRKRQAMRPSITNPRRSTLRMRIPS